MTLIPRVSPPYQEHQYNSNNGLNSRHKKAPSFLTRLRYIGGTAGLELHWAGIPAGLSPRVRRINTIPITDLNFRYKKAPSLLTRLRCVGGTAGLVFHWAGTPAGLSTSYQVHRYNYNNGLNSRHKKAPSFLTRLRCVGGTAGWYSTGQALQRDSQPRVRCTNTTPTTA